MNKHPHWHYCPDHGKQWGCPTWNCEHGEVLVCPTCEKNYLPTPRPKAKRKPKLLVDKSVADVMREMGRKGGRIGGKRSLETMTDEQRSERAVKAARVRWSK